MSLERARWKPSSKQAKRDRKRRVARARKQRKAEKR
jgi:hypothetical protein